jgi:hypothetical protein
MRSMAGQLERLNDQIEALSLGARMSDYTWFQRHFPSVAGLAQAGTHVPRLYTIPRSTPVTREICLRGLDFVTTAALHWQAFPAPSAAEVDEDAEPETELPP